MQKFLGKIRSKETNITRLFEENNISQMWIIIAILWVMMGTYFYNKILSSTSVLTEIAFYIITLAIIWKNKSILKPFFKNPFKQIGAPFGISNVLWVYPFSVLLISVIFVLIPEILGWASSDPQNIEQMEITIGEYIINLLLLPLLVFEEESFNVMMIIGLTSLLSKRMKHGWFILVVLATSCLFGFIHVFAWGWEAAISRMFIHIPFIYSILYFRNAWISMLAHFYQNALTYTSVIYPDFPTLLVGYGILACILIIVYRRFIKKVTSHPTKGANMKNKDFD